MQYCIGLILWRLPLVDWNTKVYLVWYCNTSIWETAMCIFWLIVAALHGMYNTKFTRFSECEVLSAPFHLRSHFERNWHKNRQVKWENFLSSIQLSWGYESCPYVQWWGMDLLSGWTCFHSLPRGVWTNGFISLDSSFNFKSSSSTRKPSSSLRLLMKPAIEFKFYGKTWQINSAQWSCYRRVLPWFRIWGRVAFLQQFLAALGRRVAETVRASGSE